MRGKRLRKKINKLLAWLLITVCMVSYVGEPAGGLLKVQAMGEKNGWLSLGYEHSGVIKQDKSLWVWGKNAYGELGDGTTKESAEPIKVMEDVEKISFGNNYSGAIKTDGSLWMWGNNQNGQLGNGTTEDSYKPIMVMKDVKAVSLGHTHTGAIKTDGSLWMWGQNFNGRLGNGTTEDSYVPIKVMEDVKAVSCGYWQSAAIKTDGSLWAWGGGIGMPGEDEANEGLVPTQVMEDVKAVSLGEHDGGAVKTDGSLWMWGDNQNGQLGNGTKEYSSVPIKVMDNVKAVSCGHTHTGAIKKDGSLWMWGDNLYCQLGIDSNTVTSSNIPMKVMEGIKAISLGERYYSGAVKKDGSLWMWGDNSLCQLGNGKKGPYKNVPIQIMPPGNVSVPDRDPSDSGGISLEETTAPIIKVIDSDGKPIAGASVSYNQKTFTTSEMGKTALDNYQKGKELVISKTDYVTKTISAFARSKKGIDTYILPKTGDEIESVDLIKDGEKTNLLIQEAQINRSDVNPIFELKCKSRKKYDSYALYSGDRKIAENSDGDFKNLSTGDFDIASPVSLYLQNGNGTAIKKKLNVRVVNFMFPMDSLEIGSDERIVIPEDVPLVGAKQIEISATNLPLYAFCDVEGNYKVGINVDKCIQNTGIKFPQLFDKMKEWNPDNAANFMGVEYKNVSKLTLKPNYEIMGYMEGSKDRMKGKLFIALSLSFSSENQLTVGPVPVVVEFSLTGKGNADGGFEWETENGWKGKFTLDAGLTAIGGLYGGVGIASVASVGVYGRGIFSLHYVFLPEDNSGLDEVSISGDAGVEAKIFGDSYKFTLIKGKHYIIPRDKSSQMSAGQEGFAALSLDDYAAYRSLDRSYLTADGSMPQWMSDGSSYADGVAQEAVLQNASCFDTVPQVIRMGDKVMLFYLTDAGTVRNAADRSMLVYSLWDETAQEWGEPKAVLDDGTADYDPDLYTDGEKIYAVWQDAGEKLADGLSLEETAKRLMLHAAVYDAQQDVFTDLGRIESENSLFQQNPQIVADKNSVSVYWYENAQDNVLGLSGSNRIYRAVLTDQDVLTKGIRVMSVPEEDPADTKDGEPETEESEADEPVKETPGTEDPEADEPAEETPETEETVSENTASAFRKFVALTEETPGQETITREESVSENTTPEDGEESNMPPADPGEDEDREEEDKDPAEEVTEEGPSDGGDEEPEDSAGSVSDNTAPEGSVSENTVSENSISQNTLQANTYGAEKQADGLWKVTFLQEEGNCIFSADAGRMNGKTGYAFVAGTMDQSYNVEESKVSFIEQGQAQAKLLKSGTAEKVEFSPVYAGETLTWFEAGDIHYIDENGSIADLFGESRLPSWSYTLLSDGAGPEVFFPVNAGGKADLYRIGRENGAFLPALQVTDQEDYIQYADGFVKDGQTILVYNRMKVNDKLEEVNNSLCTGKIAHSYYDIALRSAGSVILYDEETGSDELEVAVKLYNNGTTAAENLSLSLCGPDGSILETKALADVTLAPGEEKDVSAVFSADSITEEAEYILKLSGADETDRENNSVRLALGAAAFRIQSKVISVADKRVIQAGIENTGVTACGGTVSVRDSETGKVYCSEAFDPIEKGKTVVVEAEIALSAFQNKRELALEVVVAPDSETIGTVTDFVTLYVPSFEVNFVTDAGISTVYADYDTQVSFPENPTKEGKHFIGWYDAEDPSAGTFYTEETPVTQDLTLYACFADQERTQIPLSECSVSAIPMQYYTGGQLKPKVTVKWGSEVLKENRDYKVTYRNNKEQGQAAAVITAVTGNGKKYTGSIERSFSIMYPTSKVSVKAIPAVSFTGEDHTPEPVVTYRNKPLTKNKDYTVSYFNNRNAGTAGVTVTGKGTFSGEKTVTFKINGTAISGMKFGTIPDVTYNGKNTRPIVTVRTKDGKTQLMSGSDYRLVYENTVNKGTATVTVIGNGNYTGAKKLTYKVTAKPLAESMIAVEQPAAASVGSGEESAAASADTAAQISPVSLAVLPEKAVYQYTGKPIKPAITVTDQAAGNAALVLNKDYTVSYSKNKAVGEAQITVKGKGNYSGTVKVPFTIRPVDLSQGTAAGTIRVQVNDIAYTGRELKPAVQVCETVEGKERKLSGGAYTLSYADNTEKGTGTVTVTGKEKSGYTGTVTAQFRIVDKAKLITASAIKIDAVPAQTYTGSALEPVLHIVDKSDRNHEITLEKGTHYEVTYRNNISVGKATVTVRGIGSYAGSKDLTFKINKRALADKDGLCAGFTVVNPADLKYTGYALKPDVAVKDGSKLLVQGKDYKLSYGKNTNIGTAAVTVSGIGNYSGSYKGAAFQIKAWDYSTLTAEIEDQTYTGKALKPQVKFYMTGENGREEILLKPNTAVKITYKDNKNVGTATATVNGKGVLKDIAPIQVSFEIECADITEAVVSRIPNQTLKGTAVRPIPKVKVGKNSLKADRDFTVSYIRNGVKGEATVIIKGVGNYTGECRKTFIVQ